MSNGFQFTSGTFTGIDKDFLPVAYGKVYFTHPTTGEDIPTYKNSALTVVNTQPVILSATGKADIFLSNNHYNIVLTDQYDEVIWSLNDYAPTGVGDTSGSWREDQVASLDQTDFVLTNAVNSSTLVYQEGLLLTNGEDYIIIPNFTVQLSTAATTGDNLSFFGSAPTVTTSTLTSDGQIPMDNTYSPTNDKDIATKEYVDNYIPAAGTAIDFYGVTAPYGFFPCDGREISKADYGELYLAIGDIYATTGGVDAPEAANFRIPPQTLNGFGLYNRGKSPTVAIGAHQTDAFKYHKHTVNSANTNHSHDINHDHAAFWTSVSDGGHSHQYSRSQGLVNIAGSASAYMANESVDVSGSGLHNHSINVPALGETYCGYANNNITHIHSMENAGDEETRPQSLTVLKAISAGKPII